MIKGLVLYVIHMFAYAVEPPITDPPTSGQPLYNAHWLWHQLKLLQS